MKNLKLIINSFVLTFFNIFSIIFSFGIYKMVFQSYDQKVVQLFISLTLTTLGILFWGVFSAKFLKKQFIGRKYHLAWVYLLSFVWAPIIFVPIHYITQGYLTTGDNLLSIWLFQIPTNFLTLYIYYKILIQRILI